MSYRLAAAALRPAARRAAIRSVREHHRLPAGGLLRHDALVRGRTWYQGNSFHNAVTTRNASNFAKLLPRLLMKIVRVPAMLGGIVVGGYAWVHYQATRA